MLWRARKRIWCGLPWTFTVYSFDEERIFVDTGFFNKRQDEIRMYRVLDITVTRKFGQRIFGMGSIQLKTSDKTMGDFEIKNIKKVMDVKMQLSDLIEANREKKRVVSREFMTSNDADDFENVKLGANNTILKAGELPAINTEKTSVTYTASLTANTTYTVELIHSSTTSATYSYGASSSKETAYAYIDNFVVG